MNMEHLEYAVETAKAGSLSKAAVRLNVTISTVSQAVSNLEAELGVKLFQRNNQGVIPTAEGRVIIAKAVEALDKVQEIRLEASYLANLNARDLRITGSLGLISLVSDTLSDFQRDYPLLRMIVCIRNNEQIVEDLIQRQFDIGLATSFEHMLYNHGKLRAHRMFVTQLCLVVGRRSPYAALESVDAEQLRQIPLGVFKESSLKHMIGQFSTCYGPLNIVLETDHSNTLKRMIADGIVASVLAEKVIRSNLNFPESEFAVIPLNVPCWGRLSGGWIRAKDKPLSGPAKELIARIEQRIGSY
ncbi:LysR family transcriptional regulator [Cohnella sp. GCM10027633]|uniref:LysR family transcriptional regulator n=1 Tax=unclassified Cohnella TaxID=2636738 RepID=UPI0036430824